MNRLQFSLADRRIRRQIAWVERWLDSRPPAAGEQPVLFFNASTRIHHLSLNGAFSLLASWAVRSAGVPVSYLVCRRGMQQCVLGTDAADPSRPPPCERCIGYSNGLFPAQLSLPLTLDSDAFEGSEQALQAAPLAELSEWEAAGLPLGQLCLPGLRWALRRHDLDDDPPTRRLMRQYLRSAMSLASQLRTVLDEHLPRALVVFNGIMYPEAVAREIATQRGIPVVTHEVGLKPNSAFFSHGHATFREVTPARLTDDQEVELDRYLENRRSGRFSMAGVQFWPELRPLPERITSELANGRQLVSIFTNVVFDTSQVHANTLYPDMFAWLDEVAVVIRRHPETLFVVRAHPDEDRPGKVSRQSVAAWIESSGLATADNLIFVPPDEYLSSYDLIERSKFVTVYNSSIGLEAAILGVPVLCAGRARYTQQDTVTFPPTAADYRRILANWLHTSEIRVPEQLRANARAFLHAELNSASLDLSEFLEPYPVLPGMVEFSRFDPPRLERSLALRAIRMGILDGSPFTMDSPEEVVAA